jgi:hypothetical protein
MSDRLPTAPPRSILLLSADIVGATAYKNERMGQNLGAEAWLPPFERFFRELPLVFMGKLAQAFLEAPTVPRVAVWRVAGDEIVFIGEPASRDEALALVEAFANLTADFHVRLRTGWGLGLRGCAWLAPLDRDNVEIAVPEITMGGMGEAGRMGEATPFREYLGPDVDSGFRLCKHGSPGELILSPLLALSLLEAGLDRRLAVRVEGEAPLKGLYAGEACPLLHAVAAETEGNAALAPVLAAFSAAVAARGLRPLTPAIFPRSAPPRSAIDQTSRVRSPT